MKDVKSKLTAATMGLGILVLAAGQLKAQTQNCAPRETVIAKLTEDFSETRRAIGLAGNNAVVEIFAAETGGWSIVATFPNGATCLIASGEAFEMMLEPLPAKGDKT